MRSREFVLACTSVIMSVLAALGAAELVLRFLPVNSSMQILPVTPEHPVYQFVPNQSFTFSRDWDLYLVNHGRVNNAGMVNDQDYQEEDSIPLLAVIGDSFVEAKMVPYPETLQGRLSKAFAGKLRVYSFGASGAPLSQYLIWARHAVVDYKAQALIICVVGNDFDESHIDYRKYYEGFWLYVPNASGELELRLFEYHPGFIRNLIKYSALARYVFINLNLKYYLTDYFTEASRYIGGTQAAINERRLRESEAVITAFFRDLPQLTGLPASRITFVLDGFRYPERAAAGKGSYFDLMRTQFSKAAKANGYGIVDVDDLFFPAFRSEGGKFEDARDAHWNSRAHGLIANGLIDSGWLASIIRGS